MRKLLMFFALIALMCTTAFGVSACFEPSHSHSYNKQVVSTDYLKSEATCTDKAQYYYSCECGEAGTDTFEDGDALGHNYGDYFSNGDGTHTATCSHDFEHTKTSNCTGGSATCTELAVCDVCLTEYGDLLPHVFNQMVVENDYLKSEATCTAKALYYYSWL